MAWSGTTLNWLVQEKDMKSHYANGSQYNWKQLETKHEWNANNQMKLKRKREHVMSESKTKWSNHINEIPLNEMQSTKTIWLHCDMSWNWKSNPCDVIAWK